MKKIPLIFALLLGAASISNTVDAQQVHVNINIGHQPSWGPVGYDYAQYYYMPDIDVYYDVNMRMFYHHDRGHWVSSRYLPTYYSRYDLYGLHKVVLNMGNPWLYNRNHQSYYAGYRGYGHRQMMIRDSRDHRYNTSRNNHVVWYDTNTGKNYNNRPAYGNLPTGQKHKYDNVRPLAEGSYYDKGRQPNRNERGNRGWAQNNRPNRGNNRGGR